MKGCPGACARCTTAKIGCDGAQWSTVEGAPSDGTELATYDQVDTVHEEMEELTDGVTAVNQRIGFVAGNVARLGTTMEERLGELTDRVGRLEGLIGEVLRRLPAV